jgi:hypothetical protein
MARVPPSRARDAARPDGRGPRPGEVSRRAPVSPPEADRGRPNPGRAGTGAPPSRHRLSLRAAVDRALGLRRGRSGRQRLRRRAAGRGAALGDAHPRGRRPPGCPIVPRGGPGRAPTTPGDGRGRACRRGARRGPSSARNFRAFPLRARRRDLASGPPGAPIRRAGSGDPSGRLGGVRPASLAAGLLRSRRRRRARRRDPALPPGGGGAANGVRRGLAALRRCHGGHRDGGAVPPPHAIRSPGQ